MRALCIYLFHTYCRNTHTENSANIIVSDAGGCAVHLTMHHAKLYLYVHYIRTHRVCVQYEKRWQLLSLRQYHAKLFSRTQPILYPKSCNVPCTMLHLYNSPNLLFSPARGVYMPRYITCLFAYTYSYVMYVCISFIPVRLLCALCLNRLPKLILFVPGNEVIKVGPIPPTYLTFAM